MTTGVDVPCGQCGAIFTSSQSTVGRARRFGTVLRCGACKKTARSTEVGQRWWIKRFGGAIPAGMSVSTYVRSNGLPTGLSELIASIRTDD